ncbi:MAG: ATP-binding protein, partial [Bacilli bacterium]|nr:ATP-binding protein [Bacilli bacterium]
MEKEYLLELISNNECEWIEYKENWFNREELGQYISAISNSAAEAGEEYGYFIWGVNDKTHEIVGTSFEYDVDIKNEPLKHYLARLLNPSISFLFEAFNVDGKKVVCLTIPAAKRIMTEFDKNRFIRIGSSKELLRKFPEREIDLA